MLNVISFSKSSTMKKTGMPGQEDEPSFDLLVENELLMLKLSAEFGAECIPGSNDIPPVVVNEFLKSVYAFEKKFREPRPLVRIHDKIGKPFFKKEEELPDKQLSRELKRLMKLLHDHRLELDVLGEYPDRRIYKFLTEELFIHEMEDLDMQGYISHFCYEEFHPNNEMDIRQRSVEFLTEWFDRKLNNCSRQLADMFIHPDSRTFSKEEVLERIQNLFASYISFSNCQYMIDRISFEWETDKCCGKGYVEGSLKYDALMENREIIHIEGPFRFYLTNENRWWSIFYFVFPGFSWNG